MYKSRDVDMIAAGSKIKERDFWLDKLSGDMVKTIFYPDFSHSGQRDGNLKSLSFKIEGELFSRLITISKQSDPRLFVILLSGVIALLRQYSGSREILAGIPVIRQETDINLINTVLTLRILAAGEMTFKDLLLAVRQEMVDVTENQNYPLNTLLYDLGMPFNDNEFPLFDIAVLMQNIHEKSYVDHLPMKLIISFRRDEEYIEGEIQYLTSLYRRQTVQGIANHLGLLFHEVLSHIEVPLYQLEMLREEEKMLLLSELNDFNVEYPREYPLHQLFEKEATSNPYRCSVAVDDYYFSYRELDRRANRLAGTVKLKGVQQETVVGIMLERGFEMIAAIMGVLKAGGAYLPISLKFPAERIQYVLDDSQAGLVLTQEKFVALLGDGAECLDIRNEAFYTADSRTPEIRVPSDNMAYVIYTSGSTGQPKGVAIEHRHVTNLIAGLNETVYQRYGNLLNVCLIAPFEFDASVQQVFGALIQGHTLKIVPEETRLEGEGLLRFYQKYQIDISDGTPSHIRLIVEALRESKETEKSLDVRHFIIAGEAFPWKLAENFLSHLRPNAPNISNIYGPTETCVDSTFFHILSPKYNDLSIIPIGKPLPNEQVYILDKENRLLPYGIPGELWIGGDSVARGYLNQPWLTAGKFQENPFRKGERYYRTGDLARWLPDGDLEFLGRLDHQIKLRGFRVELEEIENQLMGFEPVKESVVVLREDGSCDSQLVAYIVPQERTVPEVMRLIELEQDRVSTNHQRTELPNGLPVFYLNLNEVENLYREIFEEYAYWQNGLTLEDGDCVFDIGANIGLFSLFVNQLCPTAQIYAFEPIPVAYEALRLNAKIHGFEASLFNCGIGNRQGEEIFTYFPNSPAVSGRFADLNEKIDTLRNSIVDREVNSEKDEKLTRQQVEEMVSERMTSQQLTCPVMTLSQVIRENKIRKIDLLKIDVEKAELEVLEGIQEEDWPKIRQLALEIHDVDDRLPLIVSLLEKRGYKVAFRQVYLLKNMRLYKLFAVLDEKGRTGVLNADETGRESPAVTRNNSRWYTPEKMIRDLREYAGVRLPDYMIPSSFVLMNALPLTQNGKVDRQALPTPKIGTLSSDYVAPRNEIMRELVKIWSEILGVDEDKIGIETDFFELGGHSLKVTIMAARIHKSFDIKIPLLEIFKTPTISGIWKYFQKASQSKYSSIKPVEKREFYLLSSAQKRLFFIQQLDTESTSYNIPMMFLLDGEADKNRLEAVFNRLIKRHESLRTYFEVVRVEPIQRIYEQVTFNIESIDIDKALDREEIEDLVMKNCIKPFNLFHGPLLNVVLIETDKTNSLLLIDMHHIITDGISHEILRKEFVQLYKGGNLPSLKIQYRDFAVWQHELFQTDMFKNQQKYWFDQFSGDIPVLKLPTDYSRPSIKSPEGDYIQRELEPELVKGIRQIATEKGATLYMVCLAVFNVLLARYSGQDDIIVGTDIAGRPHSDLEPIIGMFVNTLAMRNYPRGERCFREFLEEVKETSMKAFENQDFQFDELVEKLSVARDPSRNPLFDVMLSYSVMRLGDTPVEISGLKLSPYELSLKEIKFDLSLDGIEINNRILLSLGYSKKLYKEETANSMMVDYVGILNEIVKDSSIKIEDIHLESLKFMDQNFSADEESVEFIF